MLETLLDNPERIVEVLMALVGVASAIAAAIRTVAKITPNDADDEFASRLVRIVGKIQKALDRLAMNPDSTKARRK